jgi:hypothetical protein
MALHQLRNGKTTPSPTLPTKRKFDNTGAAHPTPGKKRKTPEMGNRISLPNTLSPQQSEGQGHHESAQSILPVRSRESQSDGLEEEGMDSITDQTVARTSSPKPLIFRTSTGVSGGSGTRIEDNPQKGKHTRFGSHEPSPALKDQDDYITNASEAGDYDEEEDSSGDEAPEAVTLAAGQEVAEALDKGPSQAIHRCAHISYGMDSY